MRQRAQQVAIVAVVLCVLIGGLWLYSAKSAANIDNHEISLSNSISLPELKPIPIAKPNLNDPKIAARSSVLIDDESASVLYAERAQVQVPIASTTKMMTAIVVRKLLPLDQVVEITKEDININGSKMNLRSGEKITVKDLLTGLLVASGNDAAWTLSLRAGGTREHFVELMNQQAQELHLAGTQYKDPAGLDDQGHSTPFELAMIARALLKDQVLADIVRLPEVTITSTDGLVKHELKNSNRLVNEYNYQGAIGIKTGFTPDAGHCLIAAADRNGHRLVAVVLHTDSDAITASAIEARKLLDWGWSNYDWPTITDNKH